MLPRVAARRPAGAGVGWPRWPSLGDAIEESKDRPQAFEVEQVLGRGLGRTLGRREVIGAAQGDGDVTSVRKPDDEVRIERSAQADDFHALTAEGVVRMGDGDESRRRWG